MNTIRSIALSAVLSLVLLVSVSHAQPFDDYELDTSVPSFSNAFTITIPADLLHFSSIQRAPDNITLTNNWDIFQADGIAMSAGDVLMFVDYYADPTLLNLEGMTVDTSVLEVTQALADANDQDVEVIEALIAGEYDGFQFDTIDPDGLRLHTAVIDFPEGELVTFELVTISQDEQDMLLPLFIDIIASLQKGVVFGQISASDLELPETFTREADGFTIPYPEGWEVDVSTVGQSQFVTVTMGHTFGMDTPPTPGQPSAIVVYGTMESLTGLPITLLDPETNAVRVVQQIVGARGNTITPLDIKGLRAAQVISITPDFDNWFVAIMLDDRHFIAANMFTATKEDQDFFGTVIDMISQATWAEIEEFSSHTTPSASGDSEIFTATNSGIRFEHPVGWSGFAMSSEIIGLINVDDAFSKLTSQQTPDSGQVVATLFTHRLINNLGDDLESRLDVLNTTVFTEDVGDLEATEVDDRTLYIASAQSEDGDKLVVLIPVDDNYVLLSALMAAGE